VHTQFYDHLKRVHEFDDWRGHNALPENLTVWRFSPEFAVAEPWRPQRMSQLVMPDGRRAVQGLWRHDGESAAHDVLLGLLGEFESPLITRRPTADVGDVLFAGPEDTVVVFARANLVTLIQNADRQTTPVGDLARVVDDELTGRPDFSESVRALATVHAPIRRLALGATLPLEVDVRADLEDRMYYKFLARSGEVVLDHGRPVYRGARQGRDEVAAFVVVPGVGASVERLTIDVEDADSVP
jgi:hypothetical protein